MNTGARTRLTDRASSAPVWRPDGRAIAFAQDYTTLLFKTVDGSLEQSFHTSDNPLFPSSWRIDGDVLVYEELHPVTQGDIWTLTMGAEPEMFVATEFAEFQPRFSPNGRFIAYVSDESGRSEIYVLPYPGPRRESSDIDGRRQRAPMVSGW